MNTSSTQSFFSPAVPAPPAPPLRRFFHGIRPGDKVTFTRPNGLGRCGVEWKKATGRATICFPDHIVVNCGGPHGTPGVVDEDNYVCHRPPKKADRP